MRILIQKLVVTSAVLVGSWFTQSGFAQSLERRIEITSKHSLASGELLIKEADESIHIREGFKMTPGSSLRLTVIGKKDEIRATEKMELKIYPNSCKDNITLYGEFKKSSLIIIDATGTRVLNTIVEGTNPNIVISHLNPGFHILKIDDKFARILKE